MRVPNRATITPAIMKAPGGKPPLLSLHLRATLWMSFGLFITRNLKLLFWVPPILCCKDSYASQRSECESDVAVLRFLLENWNLLPSEVNFTKINWKEWL